jgi:septum site-determining protein MinD
LIVEDASEILAVQSIGVVPEDERAIASTNRGEPLVLEANSNSRAAQALNNIAHRLGGEKTPYLELAADRDNLLTRLRKIIAK